MEESTAKEEPDADDSADQLLLHEDGETFMEILNHNLKVFA